MSEEQKNSTEPAFEQKMNELIDQVVNEAIAKLEPFIDKLVNDVVAQALAPKKKATGGSRKKAKKK